MSFSVIISESEAIKICKGIIDDLSCRVEWLHCFELSVNENYNDIERLAKRLVEISKAIRDDKQASKLTCHRINND